LDLGRFPNVPFSKQQIFKLFFASELFSDVFSIFHKIQKFLLNRCDNMFFQKKFMNRCDNTFFQIPALRKFREFWLPRSKL